MLPRKTENKVFSANDISVVICVRAHEGNPWVMERLQEIVGYYEPCPTFIIVDFGSKEEYALQIENICIEKNMRYVHVADYDTFSLSSARNIGFQQVETELVYFTDIDFVSNSEMFCQLAYSATIAKMGTFFDLILNVPAYHLTKTPSQEIQSTTDRNHRDYLINSFGFGAFFEPLNSTTEFIAPYSNNFLITTKFFSILGGYHSDFRGHGSEDFEFFIRASQIGRYFPKPTELLSDVGGSNKPKFFQHKSYTGFRSLNQLFAARAERLGLKTYHLWHPTPNTDNWRTENDWKRNKLNSIVQPYLNSSDQLLCVDSLKRAKKLVCICTSKEHWGYFLPLRAFDYELVPFYDKEPSTIAEINALLSEGKVDGISIFNPYMKSHSTFLPLFMKARSLAMETIVIERGALPNTIYYSDDVCYTSKSYSPDIIGSIQPTEEELSSARDYIFNLRKGRHLLEGSDSKKSTDSKYAPLRELKKRKIFIPLQLDDDMAVTKFVRESQTYHDMVETLAKVTGQFKDTLFVIKPHPLSKFSLDGLPENVIVADRQDNVHSLLDSCDSVVCYNSGVGLLAACHGRRIVTIGNAFYNIDNIGHFADNLEKAIEKCLEKVSPPEMAQVEKLIASYLFHRYSWFSAQDDIRDFKTRKAHGYKDIFVSRLTLNERSVELRWEATERPFSERSFGFAIANFANENEISHTKEIEVEAGTETRLLLPVDNVSQPDNNNDALILATKTFQIYKFLYSPFLSKEQKERLANNPSQFLSRARKPFSIVGRRLMKKYIKTTKVIQ